MDINYKSDNLNVNTYLYEAELIANAFSKALEDNNCLLILPIALHQGIEGSVDDLQDLLSTANTTNRQIANYGKDSVDSGTYFNVSVQDIIDAKEKCFNCNLKLPSLKLDIKLSGVLGKLKAQLKAYADLFKFEKLDLCQVSYAMNKQCIPDIIGLITILLTAFLAIMALKKLANLSILSFIKGVLSTLLSKILGALKITVEIGGSNIGCLIEALKEIALAIPTQQNIANQLATDDALALGLYELDAISGDTVHAEDSFLKNEMIDRLSKALNKTVDRATKADEKLKQVERDLNSAFKDISTVVDEGVKYVNDYIASLFAFQIHFECEATRSGMDVEEAIVLVNKLITTLNLLSSIALAIAKKDVRDKICKTTDTINSLSDNEVRDTMYKDTYSDFNNKAAEIIASEDTTIQVLVSDEPTDPGLPKLDLFNCSIDDFIQAHTLPNIISVAKKQVEREGLGENITTGKFSNGQDFNKPESKIYTFNKPSGDQLDYIDTIVKLIAIPPDLEEDFPDDKRDNSGTDPKVDEPSNPISTDKSSRVLEAFLTDNNKEELINGKLKNPSSLKCRSVDDVLDVLKSFRN